MIPLHQRLAEVAGDPNLLLFDGFDEAVVGISSVFGIVPRVAYDVDRMLAILRERHAVDEDGAALLFDTHFARLNVGPYTPALVLAFRA
jgi:hypothetical protein